MQHYIVTRPIKTEIETTNIQEVYQGGRITGKNKSTQESTFSTDSNVTFESRQLETNSSTANAAALWWDQTEPIAQENIMHEHEKHAVEIQMRTYNGNFWSGWTNTTSPEDRKDNTTASHAALILSDSIEKIQYRFNLSAINGESPVIDLSQARIQVIDTTKGPSVGKSKSILQKIVQATKTIETAEAVADAPRIYSRAEWGSPEPNSSPRWEPEYRPLVQAVVHHTASANTPDSAAAVRAIWEFHTNGHGWGDIGYNYLVDNAGNIFQGRYSDPYQEYHQGGEVVGGHTYGNNYHTTGVAVLGNFTSTNPTYQSLQSVSNIIAYKLHRFDISPAGVGARGPHVIGHRDATNTGCPGQRLYDNLNGVRYLALNFYNTYTSITNYDLWYRGQGVGSTYTNTANFMPGDTAEAFIEFTNVGRQPWHKNSSVPVRLATDNPRDRIDAFAHPSWIKPNRPTGGMYKVEYQENAEPQLVETETIAPGETARFVFTVKAPALTGVHKPYFQLVSENNTWFLRHLGVHFVFNVLKPTYSWSFVGQGAYTDSSKATPVNVSGLAPGTRFYTELRAANTGNSIWRKDETANPIKVATSNPHDRTSQLYDSTWTSVNRPALLSESSVAPGQIGTFGFWMRAPSSEGNYKEYFNLVAENYSWFNELGMHWNITVNDN